MYICMQYMCIRQMASRHLWVIVVCGWVWPMRDAHRQKCHWPTEHREVHLLLVHILDSNILVLAHVAQTINEDTNQNVLNLHPSNESTADIQCNQYKGIIHTTHTQKACNPFAYKMKMMMKWCEMRKKNIHVSYYNLMQYAMTQFVTHRLNGMWTVLLLMMC